MLPEPNDKEFNDGLIALDLFADLSLEGVTSGADPTLWDPIRIEEEEKQEEEEQVLDTDVTGGKQPAGVTSGHDTKPDGNVKSSERKYKQR